MVKCKGGEFFGVNVWEERIRDGDWLFVWGWEMRVVEKMVVFLK